MRLRMQEGRRGTLTLLLLPRATLRTAHVLTHDIKPLNLHRRVPTGASEELPATWQRAGLNQIVCNSTEHAKPTFLTACDW